MVLAGQKSYSNSLFHLPFHFIIYYSLPLAPFFFGGSGLKLGLKAGRQWITRSHTTSGSDAATACGVACKACARDTTQLYRYTNQRWRPPFQTGVQIQNRCATDMRLSHSASAMQRARQEARDAFEKPLSRGKIIYEDPHWGQQSCQFFAAVHALQQINYPALPRPMDLRMRCKRWQCANFARMLHRSKVATANTFFTRVNSSPGCMFVQFAPDHA